MKCDVCQAEMKKSTTEMDVSVKGKTIKVVNVPALLCPECQALVVKDSIKKRAQAYAKDCKKKETLDFAKAEAAAATANAALASAVTVVI